MQDDPGQRDGHGQGVRRVPPLAHDRELAGGDEQPERGDAEQGETATDPAAEADTGRRDHGETGADAEVRGPRERGEPGRPVLVAGVGDQRAPGEVRGADHHQQHRQDRDDGGPRGPRVGAAYAQVDERHTERHQHVEVELHAQRPGRSDGPEDVVVAVDVGERQVQQEVLPLAGQGRVGRRPDDQHHGVVERQQPRHPSEQQNPSGAAGPRVQGGLRHRQPEDEAGQDEEHLDEELGAEHRLVESTRPRPDRGRSGAVVLVGVEDQHGQRGQAAQPGERVRHPTAAGLRGERSCWGRSSW